MTTPADVTHLWRRAAFWISAEEADERAGRSWETLVAELVDPDPAPMARPAALDDPSLAGGGEIWRAYAVATQWLDHMATTTTPGAEKLTWFWHNHFATSMAKVAWGEGLLRQLVTLRSLGSGPFRTLLGELVIDAALGVYLDNTSNFAGNVNENLGRELLELFTVGVGNHTQADVLAVARSLTGHNVDWSGSLLPKFYPEYHDAGSKTVLGSTGNFDAAGVCDVLCTGAPKQLVARRIASKLWSAWGYPSPSDALVTDLATRAIDGGFTGRAFARAVLLHPEFQSTAARTALVRTPVEVVVALARRTNIVPSALGAPLALFSAGHLPYLPPNVAGWPGARGLAATAAWWAIGPVHTGAALQLQADPSRMPATSGLAADDAARAAFRWAGIVDPSTPAIGRLAAFIARVRAEQPDTEVLATMIATTLSPEFAAGGGA